MWFSHTPAVVYPALGVQYRQVAGIIHSLSMDTESVNLDNKSVFFFWHAHNERLKICMY
jgi:hypothetical protein